jgi:hypothetical protein
MNDPVPKFMLQQISAELYDAASAMKMSLLQTSPSKKKARASHGVGAGVTGDSVGSGVAGDGVTIGSLGEGLGGSVLQISTYSQPPFVKDPVPKFMLQQIITDV